MKRIPIGFSDFKAVIENDYYYVDKTLLIKEVLNYGQVILVTRPRRFGKTLNLSMLKYFFERSEPSNAALFENTAIKNHHEFDLHQAQYPVIFITFKNIKGSSWEHIYDKFAIAIYEELTGIGIYLHLIRQSLKNKYRLAYS